MSYAGASNACERHWVWMRMSWRQPGNCPVDKDNPLEKGCPALDDRHGWNCRGWPVAGDSFRVRVSSVSQKGRRGDKRPDRCLAGRRSLRMHFSSRLSPDGPSGFRSRFPSHRRRGVFSPRNRRMGLLSVDTERLPAHHAPSGRPPQDSRFPETSREGFPRGHKKTGGDRNVF